MNLRHRRLTATARILYDDIFHAIDLDGIITTIMIVIRNTPFEMQGEVSMDLTLLLAADYANTTADNKLNIMGVFSTINAVNFPSVHPEMFLITQLSGGPAEYGRTFRLSIKLIDEDASQEIVVFSNEVVFQRGSGGNKVHLNHLLRLVNLVFPKPGTYQFSVLADQDEKGILMIEVNQIPAPTR